jgi:hypothetical protein
MQTKNIILALFAAATASAAAIKVTRATSSIAGADFGTCTPTMDFQFGRTGRKATEGTFLPTDPVVAKGQQDALNPSIITNRICDQLTNVCSANAAAKAACTAAKAVVAGLGTKDATTATAFVILPPFLVVHNLSSQSCLLPV